MKEAVMASNKASSDDNSGRMKRRKLREMFPANKGETNESIHVSTGFHISVFEGMSLLKSEVAAIKSDVGRLRSTLGCLEPNIETLRQKLIEVQDLACELKVGGIEGIVGEVIHVVTTMWPNTMHKVAENVIQTMGENGEHNLVADICKESRKRKFCLGHPIWNFSLSPPLSLDSRAKHRICEEIPANEVDHMEDKRVTGKGKEKNGTVEEAKHRKRNKKFPLLGKISRKDSKVLKFLFRMPRRGHKSRDEVARSGQFGVSHEDIQCLWPTVPISSKVINIWTAYMSQTKSNSWFLPTFFAEQAGSNEDPSNVPVSIASTIVACGLQRFHRRLKHCVEIFIPLYDEIADHWFLLVMKLKEKIAELSDSVPEFTSLNRRLEIARATTVFGSAMTKSSDVYYNFPSFRLSFAEGNQTTDNKYDSGIYIMMQMKCYSDKWFEGYNSEEMRSALALEIVNNSSNELLKSVMRVAMKGEGCREGISNVAEATKSNAEATQSNVVVATNCDTTTDIIHEKVPNGQKCRSHRRRKSRV
ncbi:uncharacterized protein LOC112196908 isoform X2 [Rosa chinensis]|uniref:uncharacterized protein LOC112196908 isoform X2 n=1 Tax=Rosa chinensis TaxID=74649 RepID=UPI000D087E9B|nr:uncharacterized protein LOC112196908 isoform X2 [Rosa chinensis]